MRRGDRAWGRTAACCASSSARSMSATSASISCRWRRRREEIEEPDRALSLVADRRLLAARHRAGARRRVSGALRPASAAAAAGRIRGDPPRRARAHRGRISDRDRAARRGAQSDDLRQSRHCRARAHAGRQSRPCAEDAALASSSTRPTRAPSPLAGKVGEQATVMRDQVAFYLDRARAAARAGAIGATTRGRAGRRRRCCALSARSTASAASLFPASAAAELRFLGEQQDFEEMVGNLLDNAGKWAAKRGARRGRARDCRAPGAAVLRVTIDDDGPGLAPELRAQATRRGRRLDETKPGSGLGLSIVTRTRRRLWRLAALADSPLGGLAGAGAAAGPLTEEGAFRHRSADCATRERSVACGSIVQNRCGDGPALRRARRLGGCNSPNRRPPRPWPPRPSRRAGRHRRGDRPRAGRRRSRDRDRRAAGGGDVRRAQELARSTWRLWLCRAGAGSGLGRLPGLYA